MHTSTFLINLICPTYSIDENQQIADEFARLGSDLERKAILTLALSFQHCSFNILTFASMSYVQIAFLGGKQVF